MGFADPAFSSPEPVEWLSIVLVVSIKSTIIITIGALVSFATRKASAKLRHILWCATFSILLFMPFLAGSRQPLTIPILPSSLYSETVPTERSIDAVDQELSQEVLHAQSDGMRTPVAQSLTPELLAEDAFVISWPSVVLLVWFAGAVLVLGRLAIGLLMVLRLVRRATELSNAPWSELKSGLVKKIQLRRKVRLMQSCENVMPMTCIGLRPIVMLPKDVYQWPADRRHAVILHELIHIKRSDHLTQILSQMICALYWFNPIVWWAARRMRIEQEYACDEQVLTSGLAALNYAGHLLEVAHDFRASKWSAYVGTAVAGASHLEGRLNAILSSSERGRSKSMIIVAIFVMGLACGLTAITLPVDADESEAISADKPPSESVKITKEDDEAGGDRIVSSTNMTAVREHNAVITRLGVSPTPSGGPTSPQTISQEATPQLPEQIDDRYSVQDRDRLRSNGIGPAYIKEMNDAGYRDLTVEQLIALFSNGVRASYVGGLRFVGYSGLSTSDLLSLKTNGVTPEVIRSFGTVNHADFKAMNYASMISNGVTPSYVRSLNDVGYNSLIANKIVALRLAGVTSDFIREEERRGNAGLSPNELIELKHRENR